MSSTVINVALSLVVFASTVDSKPVALMDRLGFDTSVPTAFCTVILNEIYDAKNCVEDTRYTVKWLRFNTENKASISVSFTITNENTREIETSPKTLQCEVDAVEGWIVACGNLGYISWNHILPENLELIGTKIIAVRLTLIDKPKLQDKTES